MGDINSLLGAHEKTSPPPLRVSYFDFKLAIEATNLFEIDIVGSFAT